MKYSLIFTKSAEKDLAEIPKSYYSNIVERISNLQEDPRPPGVKKLKGYKNSYRIRIGIYRVLYEVYDEKITIVIIAIAHRREIYE